MDAFGLNTNKGIKAVFILVGLYRVYLLESKKKKIGCHFVLIDLLYQNIDIIQWTLVYLFIHAHLMTSR